MVRWCRTFLCLVSITVCVATTVAMDDEMHVLREELLRNADKIPQDENYLRQIFELMTYQSKMLASQSAEISDLRSEQQSILQALKMQSESLKTEKQNAQAHHVALKLGLKSQAKRIKTLERKQELYIQTIRSQAEEIKNLGNLQAETTEKDDQEKLIDKVNDVSKRIVLHSDVDILSLVTTQSTDIKNLQNNMTKISGEVQTAQTAIEAMKNGLSKKASGSTYVRWGRKSCPSINGTALVYSGFTGGSHYTESGAASNYICLSPNPLWGHYSDAHDADAKVYGTEYELNGVTGGSSKFFGTNVFDEDAPCSVCRSSRPTAIMIPGRNQCYSGWTMEYKGYLVAGYVGHAAASEYVCLDDHPEVLQGGHTDENGKLFYFVEGRCGSLPCPPYVDGRELTCVVCTK